MPFVARNTRHGKLTRLWLDGLNMSCYLREASVNTEMPTSDATAFCDSLSQFVTGLPNLTASLSGMFDTADAGLDTVINNKFGDDATYLNILLANEGFNVGRRTRAFSGIITSYALQNSVSDLVSASMNLQGVGELLVSTTLNDSSVLYAPNASAQAMAQFDRGTAGRIGATPYPGYIYVMARNPYANACTVVVKDRTTSGGATRTLGTATVPAGTTLNPGLFAGLVPSAITPGSFRITAIDRYLDADITNPAANAGSIQVYVGLVDENLSQIAL